MPWRPALDSPVPRGLATSSGPAKRDAPVLSSLKSGPCFTPFNGSKTAGCAWTSPLLIGNASLESLALPSPVQGFSRACRTARQAIPQSAQFVGQVYCAICDHFCPGYSVRCGRILPPQIPRGRAIGNRRTPGHGSSGRLPADTAQKSAHKPGSKRIKACEQATQMPCHACFLSKIALGGGVGPARWGQEGGSTPPALACRVAHPGPPQLEVVRSCESGSHRPLSARTCLGSKIPGAHTSRWTTWILCASWSGEWVRTCLGQRTVRDHLPRRSSGHRVACCNPRLRIITPVIR